MKFMSPLLGLIIAWAVYKWFPQLFPELLEVGGLSTGFSALAVLFTSGWGLTLSKLSVFEKLDDLNNEQKAIVLEKARYFRKKIVNSMVVNTLFLAASIVIINLLGIADLKSIIAPWIGYWICFCLLFWLGSFAQSWLCFEAIEKSRLALAEAQSLQKQRQAYLKKIRSDEIAMPIDHNDPHLKKYTQDYKPC